MQLRLATPADLEELVAVQEEAAVVGLAEVFPQDRHPFPRDAVLARWRAELTDPSIAAYVATDAERIVGFAARRVDELLHFGTALHTWGSGAATELHDSLLATYPPELRRIWLWVFAENHRARRFWEKQGWQQTGERTRSTYAPHPELVGYERMLR